MLTQLAISQYEALLLDVNPGTRVGCATGCKAYVPEASCDMMVVFSPRTSTLRAVCGRSFRLCQQGRTSEELVPAIRKIMGRSLAN